MFYWVVKAILAPILTIVFRPWADGTENVPAKAPVKVFNTAPKSGAGQCHEGHQLPGIQLLGAAGQCTAAGGGGRQRFQPGCTGTS